MALFLTFQKHLARLRERWIRRDKSQGIGSGKGSKPQECKFFNGWNTRVLRLGHLFRLCYSLVTYSAVDRLPSWKALYTSKDRVDGTHDVKHV